jgi:ribA/ribD-fused uncharacterized protein
MTGAPQYQERIYNYNEICYFRKTKERFGGLSNMASGFPLSINNIEILSSEALYQACRFPHQPDIQMKIISERSPMTAKMVGKPYRTNTRSDWDKIRVDLMYWCLQVKLAQNFETFGRILESTCDKPIVEESNKDAFWGAIKIKDDENCLKGINALGRLLMKLRQEYNSTRRYGLLCVRPLKINDFLLLGEPIKTVDLRYSFLKRLQEQWRIEDPKNQKSSSEQKYQLEDSIEEGSFRVSESETKKAKTSKPKKSKTEEINIQRKLL